MLGATVASLLESAGRHPVLQGAAIVAGTFVLEDAATVLAAMQVQAGSVGTSVALVSLYLGIVLGDIGLYALGRVAALFPWAVRLIPPEATRRGHRWLDAHVFHVVFVSRFLPGARLPTYTACGFLGADFWRFCLAAVVATLIWTSLLFCISLRVGKVLMDTLGAWRWVGILGFVVAVIVIGRVVARMQQDANR
jgi:membrane protein DedA with SNARE-associated domain